MRADGTKATLDIALKPEHVAHIPSDVHARLLPKTLFGEKYVDLVAPRGSSAGPFAPVTSSPRTARASASRSSS